MSRRVLVTGGAGFIGSHLVRRLLERGDQVRVLDNFSTGTRANLAAVASDVEVVEGELRSYERVHAATRGVELVFHHGALPSVPRSVQDPLTSSAVNAEGTLNVLLAGRDEGVRRVVFASSSSVYGNSAALPREESARPDPISPYAVSKLAAEGYCTSFSRVYALESVALRYFNVFGPNQEATSQYAAAVPRFISAIAAGRAVSIFGDGRQVRDFTYVSDAVEATLLAAESDGASEAVMNVGSGQAVTVEALAAMIGDILDRPVESKHLPARPAEVRDSWASIDRARELLGYEPRVGLEEGVRITADAAGIPRAPQRSSR